VLTQYLRFVKAGFEEFVRPSSARASLVIPRARENAVAIDMLARDIQQRVDRQMMAQDKDGHSATSASSPAGDGAAPVAAAASD